MDLDLPKLRTLDDAISHRENLRKKGNQIILTNGCFDLLHTGHLYFLKNAAAQGDALFIALNGEESVKALKGPTRPIQGDSERAYMLGSLEFVDTVLLFHTPRLCAEIEALAPDVYVKAGDYTIETINKEERASLEKVGADIRFLPFLEGFSTTNLINKIQKAADTL